MGDQSKDIILSIRGMSKSFGRNRVLDHINLDVRKGTVMGLMGENGAGKSTMMKCLFGTYQKDEGTIYLDGKEVNFSGPKDALENGIAMVHQELNQCLERNVVDNLFLGRYPVNSLGMIDEGRMKNEASELFRKLGMTVNLDQPMRNMSVSQRQMCEIHPIRCIGEIAARGVVRRQEAQAEADQGEAPAPAADRITHGIDQVLRILFRR